MHDHVRDAIDGERKEERKRQQGGGRKRGAAGWGKRECGMQARKKNPCRKGAEIHQRRVLEEAQPVGVGEAGRGSGQVVGVEEQIGDVGEDADGPKGEDRQDKRAGRCRAMGMLPKNATR